MSGLFVEDIEDGRRKWNNHMEYILSLSSNTVGIRNVWRFSYLVYTQGGIAFLFPYFLSLVIVAYPLMSLNVYFGQFSSQGPVTGWECCPMFKGIGYSVFFTYIIMISYYQILVALAYVYFSSAIAFEVPWISCNNTWNTCACRTYSMNWTLQDSFSSLGNNCNSTYLTVDDRKTPAEEYFNIEVNGVNELGSINMLIVIFHCVNCIVVFFCLVQGVLTIGKASYLFSAFNCGLLTLLVIRGSLLEGASDGLSLYLTPNFKKLASGDVWYLAITHSILSLDCMGPTQTYASYNKFKYSIFRDVFLIIVLDTSASIFAGFAMFSILGSLPRTKDAELFEVATSAPELLFVACPEALSGTPSGQMWTSVLFLMVITLGISSTIGTFEFVTASVIEGYPNLFKENHELKCRMGVCAGLFLTGLPFTTYGGLYLVDLVDYCLNLIFPVLALVQFLVAALVYGVDHLAEDMFLMIGHSKLNHRLFYGYCQWMINIFGPLFLTFSILSAFIMYEPITSRGFPIWAEIYSWFQFCFLLIWIPGYYLYRYYRTTGTLRMTWETTVKLNMPTRDWGPMDRENCKGRYDRRSTRSIVKVSRVEATKLEVTRVEATSVEETPLDETIKQKSGSEVLSSLKSDVLYDYSDIQQTQII